MIILLLADKAFESTSSNSDVLQYKNFVNFFRFTFFCI